MIGITKNSGSFYPDVATCRRSLDYEDQAMRVELDAGQYVEITNIEGFYRCTIIEGKYKGWTSTWLKEEVRIFSPLEALARVTA